MFENFHYKNIYLGKYTTLAGVALIAISGYLIVTGAATLLEGVPVLLTGFGLLGTKDPKGKKKVQHEQQNEQSKCK